MTDQVEHDVDGHRYVLTRDDRELGETVYELGEQSIRFVHTKIDESLEERGLGSKLVAGALDDVRASSELRVVALCPFVKHFIATHEDYADLTRR